jgi:hypothetical protein
MLGFYSTSGDEEEQVTYDDEHTASNPYCSDLSCWCHSSVPYHAEVTEMGETTTEEAYTQALSFFGVGWAWSLIRESRVPVVQFPGQAILIEL